MSNPKIAPISHLDPKLSKLSAGLKIKVPSFHALRAFQLYENGSFSYFGVNAVFGWMPCHIHATNLNLSLYQL